MKAQIFERVGRPLRFTEWPKPVPDDDQVLIAVECCAVCRTDLHVVDGDLTEPKRPLIPGHEVVGTVEAMGRSVRDLEIGQRVGVPWLGWTCGQCRYCRSNRENLCDQARFTGYNLDGGYAEYAVANQRYCLPIPEYYSPLSAAPLLCAGLIGFRSLRMAGAADCLGIYGFGAAAHIVTQVARYQGKRVFAFTRPGDLVSQNFARELGVEWAGDSTLRPPVELDASIIFAPVGELVPLALRATRKGGTVVCGGIHMSDIPPLPYEILWGERRICSVANLTRDDGLEFLRLAPEVPVETTVTPYPLENANNALQDLRSGTLTGAAVLVVKPVADVSSRGEN